MTRINWNEPKFDEQDLEEVSKVIKVSYINEGPKTKELEESFKKYLNVKYVIPTTNATAGLFLALKADSLIKQKNDFEVIVPDMTMIATATSVNWAGGKPVIVDVENERGTINVKEITKKINKKTMAIIPVHILGRGVNMTELEKIALDNDLTIIEDAAGALGSKDSNGKYLGTIGKIGVFSLQSNKIVTCGQGGIIVTNDEKYYEVIRRLRDFGRINNKEFIHLIEGYNLKFNDLSAALALSQFKKIELRKKMLLNQRELYKKELDNNQKLRFFPYKGEEIPLWVDVITDDRNGLVRYLNKHNIYPRECWPALHMNPPYKNQGDDATFPISTYISKNTLWLPNGPSISNEQIVYISQKIKEFYDGT
ncbi:MAG: DegT/DnrJ/EryC1/StrS family aminotransferase [Candidatus Pacearchaeota archaeon]